MRIAFVGDSLTKGVPGSSYLAILRQRLPEHTLINLGKGNDTVLSLHRRLARLRLDKPLDSAFLWVGVNDTFGKTPWPHRLVSALRRQRPARDLDEFQAHYRATLDLLGQMASRVIAVSPLIWGEDLGNPRNRQLAVMSRTIADLTSRCPRAEFLDLRPAFAQELAGKHISGYLPRGVIRVAMDALTLRSDARVDRKAARRGLHLTLDGLHLNSAGAEIVAKAFLRAIRGQEPIY